MAAAGTSRYNPLLIDLTGSDDETRATRYQVQVPRNQSSQALSKQLPQDLPVSNHGLRLQDSFNLGMGKGTFRENPSSTRRPLQSSYGAQSLGISGIGPIHSPPSTRLNHPLRTNRRKERPLGQKVPCVANRSEHGSVPKTNTVKRRKFHGEMVAVGSSHVSNVRDQSNFQNCRGKLGMNTGAGTPVAEPMQQSDQGSSLQIPNPSTGNLVKHETDEQMLYVLVNQVFRHIKLPLRKYRHSLSYKERNSIGTKTARRLINDSSFFEDFEANQWSLSEGYEANLAVRAEYLVDKFATKIGGSFKEVFGRNDLVPNNPIQFQGVLSGDINKAHVTRFASNFSSSNSSSEGDQVFESIPLPTMEHNIRLEPNARRQYSSSPPTSFSNDTPDGLGRVDSDGRYNSSDPKLGLPQQQPLHERRSSRLLQHTQSQESLSEDTDLVTSAPHPKPEAKVHDRKPGLSAIREANALRVASLDEGLGRPYLCSLDREDIRRTCEMMRESPDRYISKVERELLEESVLHVDFCPEEVEVVCNVIMAAKNIKKFEGTALKPWLLALMVDEQRNTERLCSAIQTMARKPGKELGRHLLRLRDSVDLCAFLQDAAAGCVTIASRLAIMDSKARTFTRFPKPSVCSLLWQREIWGMAPFRVCQGEQPFCIEMWNQIEDSIVRKSEWTDCSGDVSAISWTGSDSFVCGATAHSDYHNMQYNKPGNLLLGSASLDTLKAVDGHRIERPIVGRAENGENSLDSMRQTQDPWLYTSVVSTSHCEVSGYTFTASFDETVKVWKVSADGACIDLCGTWAHDGKVNFVVTSQNHDRVATASDVSNNAIRVYNFDKSNVLNSPYDTYCGDKAHEQAQELRRRDTWAYFPATIQWGKAPSVEKLLLVGYSPRSVTGHESDIPDEKKNSGELCIWNVKDGQRVQISSARTQNVFEVIWHPTQPIFLAATSPCGVFEPEIKTQIRLFGQNEFGTFLHIKTLDCPASDINELTLMPVSRMESYVTASCTDGNTYVWDTSQGDGAIHILGHGESLDNPIHDLPREEADTGVKFASWGRTVGRFYTGSSDGKLKSWDVRAPRGDAYVATLLSASGGISSGAFSKNFSLLLVGDATGKVHLLGVDEKEFDGDMNCQRISTATDVSVQTLSSSIAGLPSLARRPKVVIPHPEPLPPGALENRHGIFEEKPTAQSMARAYLEEGQLTLHKDRGIGAIQGPSYNETILYRLEAHEGDDGTRPLRPEWQKKQQFELHRQIRNLWLPRLQHIDSSDASHHATNQELDLYISRLSLSTREELRREGVDLDDEFDHMFEFEQGPKHKLFKRGATKPWDCEPCETSA